MRHHVHWFPILALSLSAWASSASAAMIPVEPSQDMMLPAFLTEVAVGAPSDSVVMRVSFYSRPIDGRFDGWSFIIVEEMSWPFPPREIHLDLGDESSVARGDAPTTESKRDWAVSRIEGGYLNQVRRNLGVRIPIPGMRDGELVGHRERLVPGSSLALTRFC